MIINYKRLNDNTEDDGYKIPYKDMLINLIQDKKYFSKFDCKSGFWQIKLHPNSIPWTAFTIPIGHYEWEIMPFGFKNATSIFQRKMDNIFDHLDYVMVYIYDILVTSHTLKEHYKHIEEVLKLCINNGIILSKKKIEVTKEYIDFLGQKIRNGTIELQDHIALKILEFSDKIEDTKELQKILGLLNYARSYIKDLGKTIKSLYKKTSKIGQKYFNSEDIKIIQKIKTQIKTLPKLTLPLETDYKIVIVDASQDGWGVELKIKLYKEAFQSKEQLCRYASGSFKQLSKSLTSLDYEILGVINALHSFKLFLQKKNLL